MENTRDFFCSKCQKVTPHLGSVDANGEYLFQCTAVTETVGEGDSAQEVPHHFIKFPASTTVDQLDELAKKHEDQNTGQVSLEAQEKTLSLMLAGKAPSVEEKEPESPENPGETPSAPEKPAGDVPF